MQVFTSQARERHFPQESFGNPACFLCGKAGRGNTKTVEPFAGTFQRFRYGPGVPAQSLCIFFGGFKKIQQKPPSFQKPRGIGVVHHSWLPRSINPPFPTLVTWWMMETKMMKKMATLMQNLQINFSTEISDDALKYSLRRSDITQKFIGIAR